jgi:hypothetical protein
VVLVGDDGEPVEDQPVADAPVEPDVGLSRMKLDVYDGRDGWWNPEHGLIVPPANWEFLPRGQAFVSRTVKAGDVFWLAWAPRSRTRQHRRLLGLWAPSATIASALRSAADTVAAREARREASARSRARREARYERELAQAIVAYLRFAPEHQALADSIARSAAGRAAEVGSGRVGRTRLLSLDERAALAARAQIRHERTDYHVRLDELALLGPDDDLYRTVKAEAGDAVDSFICAHRQDLP